MFQNVEAIMDVTKNSRERRPSAAGHSLRENLDGLEKPMGKMSQKYSSHHAILVILSPHVMLWLYHRQ